MFTYLSEIKHWLEDTIWKQAGPFPESPRDIREQVLHSKDTGQSGEAEDEEVKLATVQICEALLCWRLNVVQKNMYELTL